MRRPRSVHRSLSRTSLLVRLGAVAACAACAALGACSSSDGQTPSCTPNVTANGIQNLPDGCEQFPPCTDANGDTQPASYCCADAGDVASCLYAYGAGPAPTGGAGGATGSSSSSGGAGGSDGG